VNSDGVMFRGSLRRNGAGNHRDEDVGDQTHEHMEESREECVREIRKALWHVFDVLDSTESGNVAVSQLKVGHHVVTMCFLLKYVG